MGRRDTRQSPPARMQPLRPSALLEEYLDTRGGAGGDALNSDQLAFRQAEQLSRCKRSAEMGHNTGRMKARVMKTSLGGRTDPAKKSTSALGGLLGLFSKTSK